MIDLKTHPKKEKARVFSDAGLFVSVDSALFSPRSPWIIDGACLFLSGFPSTVANRNTKSEHRKSCWTRNARRGRFFQGEDHAAILWKIGMNPQ
ncbi:MAG TPA: hypothetical protein VG711_06290, partial [Phycisphaerales bacterium]|nr:hypothetical protein [Phycisphaerales bacterium]